MPMTVSRGQSSILQISYSVSQLGVGSLFNYSLGKACALPRVNYVITLGDVN